MNERSFIEALVLDAGLQLDPEKHAEFLADVELQFKQLFVLNLLDKMPQTEFAALEDFMHDDPDQDALIDFASARVGASDAILQETKEIFREQFLASNK